MPAPTEPRFLVDPSSDPVILRIEGKATFKHCGCVKDFFDAQILAGRLRFVMDFEFCTGMDSTFLGVLAGAGLQLRRTTPRGSLVLCRLNERNRELVFNLGLHRLLTVDDDATAFAGPAGDGSALPATAATDEVAAARVVLEAHRNLVSADADNAAKFQDVIAFCARQVGESPPEEDPDRR